MELTNNTLYYEILSLWNFFKNVTKFLKSYLWRTSLYSRLSMFLVYCSSLAVIPGLSEGLAVSDSPRKSRQQQSI